MIHSINRAHAQKSIEHMVMVLLGFEGSMIPTKMDFMLRMFFGGGKKNHKIFAKDLARAALALGPSRTPAQEGRRPHCRGLPWVRPDAVLPPPTLPQVLPGRW